MIDRIRATATKRAKIVGALIVSCVMASIPMAIGYLGHLPEAGVGGWIRIAGACLAFPGIVANMILARNVHGGSPWIINIADVLFYFAIVRSVVTATPKLSEPAERPNASDR